MNFKRSVQFETKPLLLVLPIGNEYTSWLWEELCMQHLRCVLFGIINNEWCILHGHIWTLRACLEDLMGVQPPVHSHWSRHSATVKGHPFPQSTPLPEGHTWDNKKGSRHPNNQTYQPFQLWQSVRCQTGSQSRDFAQERDQFFSGTWSVRQTQKCAAFRLSVLKSWHPQSHSGNEPAILSCSGSPTKLSPFCRCSQEGRWKAWL